MAAAIAAEVSEMDKAHGQGENLEVVFRAPNEYTADLVHGLLVSEGIPTLIESRMVPWMNGVMELGEGYWGDIVVPAEYADRSREMITSYLAGIPEDPEAMQAE